MSAEATQRLQHSHVYLTGFSGCGKSTIGPLLAAELGRAFVDTDDLIEKKCRRTVRWIFEHDGEAAFRKLETAAIAEVAISEQPSVIALGGGAVTVPRNRHLIKSSGVTVYLSCGMREIERRLRSKDNRPLLEVPTVTSVSTRRQARFMRIAAMLAERRPLYREADIAVSTTARTPQETVTEVITRLRRKYADG